jgi:VWFA-related protein
MRSASVGSLAATIALLFLVGPETARNSSLLAQSTTAPTDLSKQALPMNTEGRIQLNVVVRDASGNPVTGLQAQDFNLLDEGKQRKIVSLAAIDGVKTKPDRPVEVIVMIDALNNDFVEMGYIRRGLEKYLRQNGGHLTQPTSIVRLTASGMETVSHASLDGNALADLVHRLGASIRPTGIYTFPPSINSVLRLAEEQTSRPGRKLLMWLGTGWPTPPIVRETFTALDEREQRTNYHLILQISKALLDGHMVLYGGYTASEFYQRDYLKEVRGVSDVDPRALSLDVLAYKSGGRGELPYINADSVVTAALNHLSQEASAYYSLSFNPPQAKRADEFHALKVAVDRAGLTVRTASGYYDQPEYYRPETMVELSNSLQQPSKEELAKSVLVTVSQLTEILRQQKIRHDADIEKALEQLQLTERLNSTKLAILTAELPGTRSKKCADGDWRRVCFFRSSRGGDTQKGCSGRDGTQADAVARCGLPE